MDNWVVDAGPFIHLDHIGYLPLLQKLPRLLVPASVLHEVTRDTPRRSLHTISRWANVTIIPAPPPTVGLIAYALKRKWLSLTQAEEALEDLYHRSRLFITYAIIERASRRLREGA